MLPTYDEREALGWPFALVLIVALGLPAWMLIDGQPLQAALLSGAACLPGLLMTPWLQVRVDEQQLRWQLGLLGWPGGRVALRDLAQLELRRQPGARGAQYQGRGWRVGVGADRTLYLRLRNGSELSLSTAHAQRLHDHLRLKPALRLDGQP